MILNDAQLAEHRTQLEQLQAERERLAETLADLSCFYSSNEMTRLPARQGSSRPPSGGSSQ